jgi:hypothetical protein
MMNAMEGNLPGVHRDVLEVVLQQIALGVRRPGDVVRHQLEGFQFLH